MRRTAQFSMFAYGAYVVVFAMLAAVGFSTPFYAIAFGGLIALNVALLA